MPRHFTASTESFSGWGLHPTGCSHVADPEPSDLPGLIIDPDVSSLLGRGLGRSYGDAALNDKGGLVRTRKLNRILDFDSARGLLRCEAGTSLEEIIRQFLPRGWFPSVTPGTKFVSVGGAVAFDVHGKNHHLEGNFCEFVDSFDLLLASGETLRCSRKENSQAYRATVGGMGLTGLITSVELRLRPVRTAYVKVHAIKAKDLDTAFELFAEHEPHYLYSVAWIDCLASGASLGRSLLMFGHHAEPEDLPKRRREKPLHPPWRPRLRVPCHAPAFLLNQYSIRAFNTLYYAKQLRRESHSLASYESFFYPLDGLDRWNLLYGRRGFVQYQCVLPTESSRDSLGKMLRLCATEGWGSFLAVLKRFGPQDGWFVFPMPGYTLALDIPIRAGLWEFLDRLDRLVLEAGGRVYLAKDCRLSKESFQAMYPNLDLWKQAKAVLDPGTRFSSTMSRRLGLT